MVKTYFHTVLTLCRRWTKIVACTGSFPFTLFFIKCVTSGRRDLWCARLLEAEKREKEKEERPANNVSCSSTNKKNGSALQR